MKLAELSKLPPKEAYEALYDKYLELERRYKDKTEKLCASEIENIRLRSK